MKEPKDLSNKVFGKLTVLSFNSSKNINNNIEKCWLKISEAILQYEI